ncbi:ABC transporter permease [Anaerohalosphaeraceae bacterium U12dextr]
MMILDLPIRLIRLMVQSITLALVQIWVNKTRSVLTTLGIIIGVASVTAVIAALSGLKAKIMSDIETFGTNRIFVWASRPDTGKYKNVPWDTIRFKPEQFEGMLAYCPSVAFFTRINDDRDSIRYKEKTLERIRLSGIESDWHQIESRPVIIGRAFSAIDQAQARLVCLLSQNLRDKLGMDRDCTNELVTIGYRTYRVIGVVEDRPSMSMIGGAGGNEDYEVFVPFQTLYRNSGNRMWFMVMAASRSADVSEEAKAEITFFLRQRRHIEPGEPPTFRVQTVESEVRTFQKIATRFTLVAGAIVGISLLVGGIGIMNIMLVSVSERTREIGLRKAVGAGFAAILTQFLVEAVVLCCLGGLMGLGLGQLLTTIIAHIPQVDILDKAYIPAWAALMSLGFSAFVGIFFGLFPAVKAARLDPIEALRHE